MVFSKNLYRYLVIEQLVPLLLGFIGFMSILIVGQLARLARLLLMSSLTIWDVLQLIVYALPKLSMYALPMATLIGILIAFVRLKSDNELTALRCAGIGFKHLWPPVATIAASTTLVAFCLSLYLTPLASRAFREKLITLGKAILPALLQEATFIDTFPGMVFFFKRVNPDHSIDGVFIHDHRGKNMEVSVVARRGWVLDLSTRLVMKLLDGTITRVDTHKNSAQTIFFERYELSLDSLIKGGTKHRRKRGEMSIRELKKHYGKSPRIALEYHQRFALPLACLLLGGIAAPLGAIFHKRSQMISVSLGILIFLLYYVLLSAGKGLAENRLISPPLAIWTPNVFCFLLLVFLWRRCDLEIPLEDFWKKPSSSNEKRLL